MGEPKRRESVIRSLIIRQAEDREKVRAKAIEAVRQAPWKKDAAHGMIDALAENHRQRIVAVGDAERKELERDYKERRNEILNNGQWKGKGSDRNAMSKSLAEGHQKDLAESLQAQAAGIRAIRGVTEEMHVAADSAHAPPPPVENVVDPPGRPSLSPEDFAEIKRISPAGWLQRERGYSICRQNPNKFSVRSGKDEVYRCERKGSGDWLTFTKKDGCIGNNVKLAEYEAGIKDLLAVGGIFGVCPRGYIPSGTTRSAQPRPAPEPVVETLFCPPETATQAQREAGRRYLIEKRAIPVEIVDLAEQAGFLEYSTSHVVFPGRNVVDGTVRCAQLRAWDESPRVLKKGTTEGSKLLWPAVWQGEDTSLVVICESGITCLAVAALAAENGVKRPTLISTGGLPRRWIDEPTSLASAAIRNARRGIIAGECEKTLKKQTDTDVDRAEIKRRIAEATGQDPEILYPPCWWGDAADYWYKGGDKPVGPGWVDAAPRWRARPAASAPEM